MDRAVTGNVPGPFFVNERCIDCGTCWTFDPEHYGSAAETAFVRRQPDGVAAQRQALLALQACPVAAIETSAELLKQTPSQGFPALVTNHSAGEIYYCGWASRKSFGARSWLIQRPQGNVLIDVPRWSAPLARRIEAMGGLSLIVLTHRDDVADHQRWAKAFGARRWIHQADADAAPEAELHLSGCAAETIAPDLQLIPTPGHTAGSLCAVLGESRCVLFSGDHLWWNAEQDVLVCSKQYCWWDFDEQIRSLEKLQALDVAWLLPGHGHRHSFAPGQWQQAVQQTLAWIQR